MPNDATPRERLIAGAMSGTSADGVDVALTRITGRGTSMTAQLIHHHHRSYDAATRNEIFAFRGGEASCNLARLAKLGRTISLTYATAVNEALAAAHLNAKDLAAVAAHGQTLYHGPPDTIQWFDPSLVAAEVGCAVVSDFRRADLAAGGQGAPLVPFADYILFRHPTKSRVLLNIGGIANLTYISAGASINQLIAFDTGPGNCISDYLCRTYDPTGPGYDHEGRLALTGRAHADIIKRFFEDAYFEKAPPKSTDTPSMIKLFQDSMHAGMTLPDMLATACATSATAIRRAIRRLNAHHDEMIVSGGGTRNGSIMYYVSVEYGGDVRTIDDLGLPSEAKEALAFALLGAATLDGVPSNVPSVTGAKRAVVLGSITPKP